MTLATETNIDPIPMLEKLNDQAASPLKDGGVAPLVVEPATPALDRG